MTASALRTSSGLWCELTQKALSARRLFGQDDYTWTARSQTECAMMDSLGTLSVETAYWKVAPCNARVDRHASSAGSAKSTVDACRSEARKGRRGGTAATKRVEHNALHAESSAAPSTACRRGPSEQASRRRSYSRSIGIAVAVRVLPELIVAVTVMVAVMGVSNLGSWPWLCS